MSAPDPAEGVFIYHPLAPGTPLHQLWRDSLRQPASPHAVAGAEVRQRYRMRIRARLRGAGGGVSEPDPSQEDQRDLVRTFRAFWPAFLTAIGAPADRGAIPLHFPVLDLFDARVVETKGERGIFVSSRMLDAIELFANTLAMCTRLNGLAAPAMLGYDESPPPTMALAWQSLLVEGIPGLELYHLKALPVGRKELRNKIDGWAYGGPAPLLAAVARWRLGQYLAQTLLVGMEHAVNSNSANLGRLFGVPSPPSSVEAPASMDSGYLASLVLAFIALHEQCHLLHRHDSLAPMEEHPIHDAIVERTLAAADELGIDAIDLRNTAQRLEQDADCFAIEAVPEEFRDAILETASLWFTALASADRGGVEWLEKSMGSEGRAYPQYAMRVWFLNGRYSSGRRQGVVAQEIRRAAEAVERRPSALDFPLDELIPRIRGLWDLARDETGEPGRWGRRLMTAWKGIRR